MEEIEKLSNDISRIESNLIAEINDLKATTEIVLKELTLYLSISATDISKIKDFNEGSVADIKNNSEILCKIKKRIEFSSNNMTNLSKKIFQTHSKQYNQMFKSIGIEIRENSKDIRNLNDRLKSIMIVVKSFKEDLNKEQDKLLEVITTLIQSGDNVNLASVDLQKTKVLTEAEKQSNKNKLYIKIVGGVIGSSGLLWLLIETIKNGLSG